MVIRETPIETYVDDLTGEGGGVRPFTFTVDGIIYTMDACLNTREDVRGALSNYMAVARSRVDPGGHDTKVVREWAKREGYPVLDSGRIPDEIIRKYVAAHP